MNIEFNRFARGAASVLAFIASLIGYVAFSIAHADASSDVLFEQPSLPGIEGNFHVPPAEHRPLQPGVFQLVIWQPNPNRSDGLLVPTDWKAGDKTGFYPSSPVDKHQVGYSTARGTTTAQIDGDTVGAYINSGDLPSGSHLYKLMITPTFGLAPKDQVHPFATPGRAIVVSLELQIPTAVDAHKAGSETYAVADLFFIDRNRGIKISYGVDLFFNGYQHRQSSGHIRLDQDSQSMMINSVIGMPNAWMTKLPGSAVSQSSPWVGWKTFRYAITEKNFIEALNAFKDQDPAAKPSVNPSDYAFETFHLNAELHFRTGPAALGWSMRHAKVVVVDATTLR